VPRALHLFPTRRSSDLAVALAAAAPVRSVSPGPWATVAGSGLALDAAVDAAATVAEPDVGVAAPASCEPARIPPANSPAPTSPRSEEHTSELQSLAYLV